MTGSKPYWALLGLVLVLVVLVYAGVVDYGFVRWDDHLNVYQNPYFPPKSFGDIAIFWRQGVQQVYVPVTSTIWGIVSIFAQSTTPPSEVKMDATNLVPGPFHVLNLVTHLLCTVLVFVLLRRLKVSGAGSVLGAAIFALHPIQVESVAWITAFKELGSGFFGLIAILCQMRAVEAESGKLYWRWSIFALIAFVLAILSLALAISVPLICLVMLSRRDGKLDRRSVYGPAIWMVIGLAVAAFTKSMQPTDTHFTPVPLAARFAIAGDSLLFYAGKILWPFNFGIDYGRTPEFVMSRPGYFLLAFVPLLVATVTFVLWKRGSRGAVAIAFFAGSLLPVLGFVPFIFQIYSTVADRYAYSAMIGVGLAAGLLFDKVASRGSIGTVSAAVCAVALCLFLAFQTTLQTIVWRNNNSLFTHAIEVNPNAWGQHNNLSLVLLDTGELDSALEQVEIALKLKPDFPQAWLNRGTILVRLKRFRRAKESFEKVIQLKPEASDGYYSLAIIYYGMGQKKRALELLDKALQLQPGWTTALDLRQKTLALPDTPPAQPKR